MNLPIEFTNSFTLPDEVLDKIESITFDDDAIFNRARVIYKNSLQLSIIVANPLSPYIQFMRDDGINKYEIAIMDHGGNFITDAFLDCGVVLRNQSIEFVRGVLIQLADFKEHCEQAIEH